MRTGKELCKEIENFKVSSERPARSRELALAKSERVVRRVEHKCRNSGGEYREYCKSRTCADKVKLLCARIDLGRGLGEVEVEEIKHGKYAHHIADVVVGDKNERQRYGVELVATVENELLNAESHKRKPYKRVYPHRVALLTYRICRERIHHREGDDRHAVAHLRVLVQIITERESGKSGLEQNDGKYRLLNSVLREERDYIGERACKIISVHTHKLAAERARE